MDMDKIRELLESQLFVLAVMDAIEKGNKLSDVSQRACGNAIAIAATTIDRIIEDNPDLAKEADVMMESFTKVPE